MVDNPWLELRRQARNGGLVVADGAAQAAVRNAAEVAYRLGFVRDMTGPLTEHIGFSDNGVLKSAITMAERCNHEGRRLNGIIDHYIDLVNAMGETLIDADNKYKTAEEDSRSQFDKVKKSMGPDNVSMPTDGLGTGTAPVWYEGSLEDHDAKAGATGLPKVGGNHYGDAIGAENPYAQRGKWFWEVGQGIHHDKVAEKSSVWKWVGSRVDEGFTNLVNGLEQLETKGLWKGDGADAAIAAAKKFKAQATDFTGDLRVMAGTLYYFSGVLEFIKRVSPDDWNDEWNGTKTETDIAATEAKWFAGWYTPGLAKASANIPIFTDPTVPASTTSGGGGGQNQGGGGSGSSGGQNKFGLKSGTTPNLTMPSGTKPGGTDPSGTKPGGTDPSGTKPGGTDPNGTKPGGTDPGGSSSSGDGSGSGSSSGSSDSSGLSSALSGLQSAAQQASSAASTKKASTAAGADLSGLSSLLGQAKQGAGKGGGGAGGGGGPATNPAAALSQRLFPRAAVSAEGSMVASASASRAGIAASGAGMPMGGMPMGGHGAQGGQQGGKEHKRPDFLDSTEYLEEAMGAPPIVAKPVVEG
ncbi:hypothetical protein [Nocardia inohanensis]|uniref:hypothetical protein n=1 Tax=Nocardia inohanensis TaxID=209246 RepID=UPI00082A6D5C|nr:hypothetical protein [Nocardia inohanensis]